MSNYITFKTKQSITREVEGKKICTSLLINIERKQLFSFSHLTELKSLVVKEIKHQASVNVKINSFYVNLLEIDNLVQIQNALTNSKGQDFLVDITLLSEDEVNVLKTIRELKEEILNNQTQLVELGKEREHLLERLNALEAEILKLTHTSQALRQEVQKKLLNLKHLMPSNARKMMSAVSETSSSAALQQAPAKSSMFINKDVGSATSATAAAVLSDKNLLIDRIISPA